MLDMLVLNMILADYLVRKSGECLATPSLLGRDVMRKFKLIYSEAKEYVALERN
jgi:hypothetical protein